jgi:nitrogen fixation NifU-like protein
MSDLRDLYQQVIIDHSKNPRNFCVIEKPSCSKEGNNPICGDRLVLYINEKNGIIEKICFQGSGCAISMASASLMTELLQGKTVAEALQLFNEFQQLVTTKDNAKLAEKMGKLAVLAGVSEYPIRIKCATLPWHTLKAALQHENGKITTE